MSSYSTATASGGDARRLPKTDVVVVGLGWTGSIAAMELAREGLDIVGLERGPGYTQNDAFSDKSMHDALLYGVRSRLAKPLENSTLTFRNASSGTALPMRRIGSFNPSEGFGGSGNTWSGHSFRPTESDMRLRSHITERYGRNFVSDDMTIQDWGVSWEELEPHFARFEAVAAVSGTAGNVRGAIRPGGNPFESPRSGEYELPAFERHASGLKFAETASELGYHPFPVPTANASEDYTNPYGADMPACRVCGHCPSHACIYGSKGAPVATIHPALLAMPNFEARAQSTVVGIEKNADGRTVSGVTYIDAAGRKLFQPADIVILSAYTFDNLRLLLLSDIGTPYDPQTGRGTLGRNYSYQMLGSVNAFFEDEFFSPQAAGGAMGTVIDDFGADHFDHADLGFIGGGFIGPFNLSANPITYHPTPSGAPPWGAGWKEAVTKWYQRTLGLNIHCGVQSYRGNYLDLDPTYTDTYGLPLLRMTFDFRDNERRMIRFMTERAREIARAMGADIVEGEPADGPYDITRYQTTHNVGGTAMGTDPATSVVNRRLQHWDAHNLFVLGGSVFPQNSHYNPTVSLAGLAYWAVDGIARDYLPRPGRIE